MTSVAAVSALDASVLVLNKFFQAVHVVTARRAFALLCKECAEVVDTSDDRVETYDFASWTELSQYMDANDAPEDDWVRTVSQRIKVPRIVRLLFYDRYPRQSIKFNRRNIFARDDGRCQYCGKRYPTGELSIDHVIPRSRGGRATWENVVCACTTCNIRKANRTPREAKMDLLKPPKRPHRSPVLTQKLRSARYACWATFVEEAYWSVTLRE